MDTPFGKRARGKTTEKSAYSSCTDCFGARRSGFWSEEKGRVCMPGEAGHYYQYYRDRISLLLLSLFLLMF